MAFTTPVTVSFSSAVAPASPTPAISPAVPGSWAQSGSTMTFTPSGGWAPYARMTVTVPAGIRSRQGGALAAPVSATWSTGAPSMLRLQQVLASLGYLPLSFTPTAASSAGSTVALPGADQQGSFAWASPNVPATLAAQWTEGQANGITRGAVMAFEADHHLAIDGLAGPEVWAALANAVTGHQVDPRPYDYIAVTQTSPETLSVWQGGKIIYTSLANTGVPGATTATGTFPVYERFVTTTMRGTNPDGTKYVDPGIPWVAYFNGGDAIHGFVRAGYGYPQSDGCVELPPDHAQVMYPLDYYGTLVTVS
ncbi:L,D-transpeptidase family protein [Acidiferrimicrobium sp. IK]|uniref:L,D-transpeptidase family protein n=1 Tax=Acidiferrimicrobium sp. IK TaxID=2871700 RepID=UPI0021CAFA8C|nr:L,D-transpeptidase family protein [Acidiferrimicrobium sp. IK]